ncbi:MAG: hypothetical protein KC800_05600 [Candidatus Eremiobacteraeota bacterium]|nr:hypothetical protein [Candidatus Eremiobacteraeota bacterium]
MNQHRWDRATQSNHCPNCGSQRRCHIRHDGEAVRCYFPHKGSGWGYLQDSAKNPSGEDDNGSFELRYAEPPKNPDGPTRATFAECHKVYARLLELLPLTDTHSDHLERKQSLLPALVKRYRLASLPPRNGRFMVCRQLEKEFGKELLQGVPGFKVGDTGGIEIVAVSSSGILIPYRSGNDVTALRWRLDKPGDGGKYRWISGGDGPPVRTSAFVADPSDYRDESRAIVVEGEWKAIHSAEHFGELALGVPGVSGFRLAGPMLAERGIETAALAYDADQRDIPEDPTKDNEVARQTIRAAQWIRGQGYELELIRWWTDFETAVPKGIDDAIRAGIELETLTGDEVDEYLSALAERHGIEVADDQGELEESETPDDGRPVLFMESKDLYAQKQTLAKALKTLDPPAFFIKDRALVTVCDGEALSHPGVAELRSEMDQLFRFTAMNKRGEEVTVFPLQYLVESLRSTPHHLKVPVLRDFTVSPVVLPDGTVTTEPGYYPSAQTLYTGKVRCADVPQNPTRKQIEAAVALLMEPLQDFPFFEDSDRANALSLALAIVGRGVIAGLMPAYMVAAATHGTGKGLLASVLCLLATGQKIEVEPWKCDGEEFRKSVTSSLMEGSRLVCFDNVNDEMDSGNFAAVVTADVWKDRQLGANKNVKLENRTIFMATANNPAMSAEVQRRFITIELASNEENPADRSNFKIRNLSGWIRDRQGELIAALLTLWRAWFAAGKPRWRERKLGSFEPCCEIIGGVLNVAGIPGFLANKERVRAEVDSETAMWGRFTSEWLSKYKEEPVTVSDLHAVCLYDDPRTQLSKRAETLLLPVLGAGNEHSQRTRLGKALGRIRNRVFGSYRVRKVDERSRHTLYSLEYTRAIPTKMDPQFSDAEENLKNVCNVCTTDKKPHNEAKKEEQTFLQTCSSTSANVCNDSEDLSGEVAEALDGLV